MKRLLVFVFACSVIFIGCSKDDDNVRSGPGDFMISVTFNGVTHKAEGNTPTDMSSGMGMSGNHCLKYMNNMVMAGLSDKSATSYVSGDVFSLSIIFPNLSIGNSIGQIIPDFNNFTYPSGANSELGYRQNIDTSITSSPIINLDFNITSLGSLGSAGSSANNYYTYGDPLVGSFSGTVFGTDGTIFAPTSGGQSSGYIYNIPIPIEIEFIAARCQY